MGAAVGCEGESFPDYLCRLASDPTTHERVAHCRACDLWDPAGCPALPPEPTTWRGANDSDIELPAFCPVRREEGSGDPPLVEGVLAEAIARVVRSEPDPVDWRTLRSIVVRE